MEDSNSEYNCPLLLGCSNCMSLCSAHYLHAQTHDDNKHSGLQLLSEI